MFTSISPIFRVWEAIHLKLAQLGTPPENGILAIHIKAECYANNNWTRGLELGSGTINKQMSKTLM
jgi:hypothetical protein